MLYVVYQSTVAQMAQYDIIIVLENLIDVIASLSNNTFSFIFSEHML